MDSSSALGGWYADDAGADDDAIDDATDAGPSVGDGGEVTGAGIVTPVDAGGDPADGSDAQAATDSGAASDSSVDAGG